MIKKIDALRTKMLNASLWTALLFLPFFEPAGLGSAFEPSYWFFAAYKVVVLLVVFGFFLARPKFSALTAVMGVYQVVLLVSTLINRAALLEWAYKAAITAGMCLLVDQCVDVNIKAMIKGLFFTLGTLCLINLATVILFPGGMAYSAEFFLSWDNCHALFLIPAMGIAVLYAVGVGWPFPAQLGMAVVLASAMFITWSVTGMLAALAFIALLVLGQARKSCRVCNIAVYYGVIVALFLALIVFHLPEKMGSLLEGVLHKSGTLSGRTPIWDTIVSLILKKPLLGYGKLTINTTRTMFGAHCHNIILQTCFDAGVVGLAVFLVQMGLMVPPLWRTRGGKCGYILAATVFSLLVYCMAEGQLYPMGYTCIFMLAYHAEKITAALEPGASPESA